MSSEKRILQAAWDKCTALITDEEIPIKNTNYDNLLSSFFCPGPFYYYIFDFRTRRFSYVHNTVESLLGVDQKTFTIDDMISRIHPEDIPHMANGDRMAFEFIINRLPLEKRKKYKISYCIRIKTADGNYKLFLQQAMAITLDAEGNLGKVLGIHSDISHITTSNSYQISFIGMDNEPSYYGVKPSEILEEVHLMDKLLSKREIELVRLLAEGLTAKEAAEDLSIAVGTVRSHRQNIFEKTRCRNSTELVAKCIREGLI